MAVLSGAVVGLLIAVAIGFGFYRGARVLNLRTFFRWTGVALIFIAAGLLSHAVHELALSPSAPRPPSTSAASCPTRAKYRR